MKQLLAAQEILHPRLFHSLQKALTPLMSMSRTGYNINDLVELGEKKIDLKKHAQSKLKERQGNEGEHEGKEGEQQGKEGERHDKEAEQQVNGDVNTGDDGGV